MNADADLPPVSALMDTTIAVLETKSPMTIFEIESAIAELLKLPSESRTRSHKRGGRTELGYRAAWARTLLRKRGLVERVGPREWAIVRKTEFPLA